MNDIINEAATHTRMEELLIAHLERENDSIDVRQIKTIYANFNRGLVSNIAEVLTAHEKHINARLTDFFAELSQAIIEEFRNEHISFWQRLVRRFSH